RRPTSGAVEWSLDIPTRNMDDNPHARAVSEDQEGFCPLPCGCGTALFVFLCLELGQCQPSARSFVNDLPLSRVPSYQFQLLATSAAAQMCPEDQDLFAWF